MCVCLAIPHFAGHYQGRIRPTPGACVSVEMTTLRPAIEGIPQSRWGVHQASLRKRLSYRGSINELRALVESALGGVPLPVLMLERALFLMDVQDEHGIDPAIEAISSKLLGYVARYAYPTMQAIEHDISGGRAESFADWWRKTKERRDGAPRLAPSEARDAQWRPAPDAPAFLPAGETEAEKAEAALFGPDDDAVTAAAPAPPAYTRRMAS